MFRRDESIEAAKEGILIGVSEAINEGLSLIVDGDIEEFFIDEFVVDNGLTG